MYYGWSLGKVHKKDPYREEPVLLIRVFLMYLHGQRLGKVHVHKKAPYREGPVLLIRVFLMYVGGA